MGLWQRLFGRRQAADPTRAWTRTPGHVPRFDLGAYTLDGVPLGGPLERLRALGPAEGVQVDPSGREGDLEYPSQGLAVGVGDGRVESYELFFQEAPGASDQAFTAYRGHVTLGGDTVPLSAATTEAELRALLGEPYWRDSDDDEVLLFYERAEAQAELQVELRDGRLRSVWAVSPGLLGDAEQRRRLGVTRPWPPPAAS